MLFVREGKCKVRHAETQKTDVTTTNPPCFHIISQTTHYPSILTISRPFDSLFRVLFTFPSQYLFAIGLGSIFSLGRNLPPIFTLDSQPELLEGCARSRATREAFHYGAITLLGAAFPNGLGTPTSCAVHAQPTDHNSTRSPWTIFSLGFGRFTRRY